MSVLRRARARARMRIRRARRGRSGRRDSPPRGADAAASRERGGREVRGRDPRSPSPRPSVGEALKGAAWEARYRTRRAARATRSRGGRLLVAFARLLALPVVALSHLVALVRSGALLLRGRVERLSAAVRPAPAAAAVAAAAAVILFLSQFATYRGVEVGGPAYEGTVSLVAPSPQTELRRTGSAHSYLLAPVALLALLLVPAALKRNWRLARLVALCGAAGIAVSLLVTLGKATDVGAAGAAYLDAKAVLLGGFWAQLVSSAMLVFSGLLLGARARRVQTAGRRPVHSQGRARGRRSSPSRPVISGPERRWGRIEGA